MPPAKRRPTAEPPKAHDDRPGTDVTSGGAGPAAKRQRVSLACDHCRAARGRCDGGRPSCDVCLTQDRTCSYTSSTRRRGTPTGYLRAVESSLAFLLDQVPENAKILERLLRHDADIFTGGTSESSERLHKRWTTSRFRKEMWRMLVDGYPSAPESSDTSAKDEDTATEADDGSRSQLGVPPLRSQLNTPPAEDGKDLRAHAICQPNAQLPPNWRHLLDVYFAYTHCWLPILDKDAVISVAITFPPEGISAGQISDVPPAQAELWAVLALASFQDAAYGDTLAAPSPLTPRNIYSIARNMMPSEEKRFELPHLRALLLHSLVLMGQGSGLAAWMLIGTALRLALHLRETGDLYAGDDGSTASPGTRAFAASLVLNTFASAYLGQQTFLSVDTQELSAAIDAMGQAGEAEPWTPIFGSGPPAEVNPLQNFRQLYKIGQILSALLRAGGWRSNQSQGGPTTEDLIKCLDPNYSFCNSVVLGSSTPPVPSAFVLQACFLTTLTQCAPGHRASLLSSLREVVESCENQFGPCGVPPIIVCLAGTALRSRHADRMEVYERDKWERLAGPLRTVWIGRGSGHPSRPVPPSSNTTTRSTDPGVRGQEGETLVKPEMPRPDLGTLLDMQINPPCLTDPSLDGSSCVGWTDEQPMGYDSFFGDLEYVWLDSSTPYLC